MTSCAPGGSGSPAAVRPALAARCVPHLLLGASRTLFSNVTSPIRPNRSGSFCFPVVANLAQRGHDIRILVWRHRMQGGDRPLRNENRSLCLGLWGNEPRLKHFPSLMGRHKRRFRSAAVRTSRRHLHPLARVGLISAFRCFRLTRAFPPDDLLLAAEAGEFFGCWHHSWADSTRCIQHS